MLKLIAISFITLIVVPATAASVKTDLLFEEEEWMAAGLLALQPDEQSMDLFARAYAINLDLGVFIEPWVMFDWAWNLLGDVEGSFAGRVFSSQEHLDQLYQILDVSRSSTSEAAEFVIGDTLEKIAVLDVDGDRAFDLRVQIRNGQEVFDVPEASIEGGTLTWSFPQYDSRIVINELEEGVLQGAWFKLRGDTEHRMEFLSFQDHRGTMHQRWQHAQHITRVFGRIHPEQCDLSTSRWRVSFAESGDAVGVFDEYSPKPREWAADAPRQVFISYSGLLRGTVRTPTDDFYFLSGDFQGVRDDFCGVGAAPNYRMSLSAFDGAHAYLFRGKMIKGGSLEGDFYSGNWHHETWTAVREVDSSEP